MDYAQCVRGTCLSRAATAPKTKRALLGSTSSPPSARCQSIGHILPTDPSSCRLVKTCTVTLGSFCRSWNSCFPMERLGHHSLKAKHCRSSSRSGQFDGGVFNRASQLIPASMPLLNDPKFTTDRQDFSGRSWEKSKIEASRPEALAHIRNAFNLLETTLLSDDREWVLKTEKPSLGDIEGERPWAASS